MQVESSICSSTGSNALGVRRDRRKRQPSWMNFLRPEHLLQERDQCWFAVHMITTGGLDLLAVHNAVSKACFKVPLSGFVGRIGRSGTGHAFTSANAGLACIFRGPRFSNNPSLMHVLNPFKSVAFQVNIPRKTVIYTAAVVRQTSSKEFKVVAMAEFDEVMGVCIYESETKVWRLSWKLKPLQYLVFYSCNVVVGNVFCFMAKSGRDGYPRVLFYDMEAEGLTEQTQVLSFFGEDGVPKYAESISIVASNLFLCKGKLTVVDTVLTGSPSFSGGSEDEDEEVDVHTYSQVIVWQMDEKTRKWEEVAKMPDDLWNKLHSSCDMYSKLKVCGAGKFVFMQFEHWTPFEHRPDNEHAVICNLETGVWELHLPKPSTIKYSRCLDVLALDPDQSFAL